MLSGERWDGGRRTQDSKCGQESGPRDRTPRSLRPDCSRSTTLCNTIIVHQDLSRKTTIEMKSAGLRTLKCSHESGRRDWIPRSLRPDFSLWTTLSSTIIIGHQDFSRKITVGIRVGVRVGIRLGILSSNQSRNQRRRQIGSQSGYGGRRTQEPKCGQESGPSYLLGWHKNWTYYGMVGG